MGKRLQSKLRQFKRSGLTSYNSSPSKYFIFAPFFLFLVTLLVFWYRPGRAERPVEAELVGAQPEKELRLDLGIDYSHIRAGKYLLAFPSLGLNYSAGPVVDLQAYYDFLYRFTVNAPTIYGTGDLTLWTKVRFVPEKKNFPGLGLRFGVKLPNANAQDGLGSDQTDFYASVLLSKSIGRFENRANVGLAILDDPFKLRGQQDMLTVALASIYEISSSWQTFVDFYSQQGAEARFRFSKVSTGLRFSKGDWVWDMAWKKGLRSDKKGYQDELSLDWGIILGVSRYFDLSGN